ncbi:CDP-glycerol glycerophosphotransferase family protein [Methanobrevibacter sp.]|uniref:bifunctional glycosyltransferase/CDP-glycerol:glycerophosphate glycerophosphotransferase n=1 Tax=Methanobrevibacter sp. TaxID=66852 RepID=UPI0038904072
MVFVSVIIAFNKGERYLKDCLDSLSEQNLKDAEIIIILNGCKEDVDELLNSYTDLNLVVKSYDEELGVGKARNEGLDIASGEYVYFMDSDDYLYQNGLAKLIDVAKENNYDLVNGERVATYFIRDRFEENPTIMNEKQLQQLDSSDIEYSFKMLTGTKTNRLEILSVLHSLIKRDKIGEARFREDERYFADYYFIMDIFDDLNSFYGVENAIYAKRSRDDPIHLTSLIQEEKEFEFLMYCDKYKEVQNWLKSKSGQKYEELSSTMSYKYLRYYLSRYAIRFLSAEDDIWRNEYFDVMSDISQDFKTDPLRINLKKEIQALQTKDKESLAKYIKLRARTNKFKKMLSKRWMFKSTVYTKYYNKHPLVENKIVFESFLGKYYSDSPKYLYEYLYNTYGDKFEYVWVINDKNVKIPGNPKKVKRFSLEFYKEVAEAKYWVINGRQAARLKKREDQVIVSTWHGTPLKRLGLDIGNVHTMNPKIKQSYISVGRTWDYLISPNPYTTEILKSAFAYEGQILETGYPRNDILYNADENQINQIKKDLKLPEDKKIILYAPTWRDDEYIDVGKINFELKLELDKLMEALSDEYIVLVRTHYFIANNLDLSKYKGFAFDVSSYNDIAELYLISDILITDYSSVFFDFANLKRPILFYTYDLEKYENVLRGFYIDIHTEVPGPLLKTTEEVIENIKNIEELKEEYADRYDEFYERFCGIEDGNASKRISDIVWLK